MNDEFEPDLQAIAARLEAQRPLPAPAFRGALRRQVIAQSAPRGLGARIAALAGSGATLVVLVAVSAAGFGPLGA